MNAWNDRIGRVKNDTFTGSHPFIEPFNLRYERLRQRLSARRPQKNRKTKRFFKLQAAVVANASRRHLDLFPTPAQPFSGGTPSNTPAGSASLRHCAPIGARLKRSRCRRSAIAALLATTAANEILSCRTGQQRQTTSERPSAVVGPATPGSAGALLGDAREETLRHGTS